MYWPICIWITNVLRTLYKLNTYVLWTYTNSTPTHKLNTNVLRTYTIQTQLKFTQNIHNSNSTQMCSEHTQFWTQMCSEHTQFWTQTRHLCSEYIQFSTQTQHWCAQNIHKLITNVFRTYTIFNTNVLRIYTTWTQLKCAHNLHNSQLKLDNCAQIIYNS